MNSEENQGRRRVVLIGILLLAFILHTAFSSKLQIRAARPNLALTALLIECLFVGPNSGAALGFTLGLLEAAYAARFVGSLIVSRTIVGFCGGGLEDRIYRDNVLVAVGVVAVGTLLAEGCLFLFAPQPNAAKWATRILGETAFNAALAIPMYVVVRPRLRERAK